MTEHPLWENVEHLARHLAAICDAQDAGEDVRPHIHLASAFLLSLGSQEKQFSEGHK